MTYGSPHQVFGNGVGVKLRLDAHSLHDLTHAIGPEVDEHQGVVVWCGSVCTIKFNHQYCILSSNCSWALEIHGPKNGVGAYTDKPV